MVLLCMYVSWRPHTSDWHLCTLETTWLCSQEEAAAAHGSPRGSLMQRKGKERLRVVSDIGYRWGGEKAHQSPQGTCAIPPPSGWMLYDSELKLCGIIPVDVTE